MLIWQFRDDPQVVKFMTRFVAKVCTYYILCISCSWNSVPSSIGTSPRGGGMIDEIVDPMSVLLEKSNPSSTLLLTRMYVV